MATYFLEKKASSMLAKSRAMASKQDKTLIPELSSGITSFELLFFLLSGATFSGPAVEELFLPLVLDKDLVSATTGGGAGGTSCMTSGVLNNCLKATETIKYST